MASTFNVFGLGQGADLASVEGNNQAENAAALVGSTFGGTSNPVHRSVVTFAPGASAFAGGQTERYVKDSVPARTFRVDGGPDQTFDGLTVYNATLTYVDGTTAKTAAVVFQDTAGNLYLAPMTSSNSGQDALETKPIVTLTIDSMLSNFTSGLEADRVAATYGFAVDGAAGNDELSRGYIVVDSEPITSGDDDILGNGGNDTLAGGKGLDGFTNDRLNIVGLRNASNNPVSVDDVKAVVNGGRDWLDFPPGKGITLRGVSFAQMSSRAQLQSAAIPSFTSGTRIATPQGEVPVEALAIGDKVLTRDNGFQTIRSIGTRNLGAEMLQAHPKLRPVRIAAGTFGNPEPVLFSPQQGVLYIDPETGEERLARAAHLAKRGGGQVRFAHATRRVTYVHLLFDRHQLVLSGGIWSESSLPGPIAPRSLEQPQMRETATLFPKLFISDLASAYGRPARRYVDFKQLPRRNPNPAYLDHRADLNSLLARSGC